MAPVDPFDASWYRRHLVDDLLPRWLGATVTPEGLFLPHLDRAWRPSGRRTGTLVSQGRLLFNFAQGLRLTGDPAYREAVARGARFLVHRFLDREHGGCIYAVTLDGTVADDRKDAYGHAFALFGLAHAYAATDEALYREAAADVWSAVRTHLADAHGGLVIGAARDWTGPPPGRSQNPVMHLFEALLALGELVDRTYLAEAAALSALVLGELVRPGDGALPEVYDDDWRPLPEDRGGRIDVGHQFEWAWLLSQADALGVPGDWLAPAHRLLDAGMRLGFDGAQGGIWSPAAYDGTLRSRSKGWWEQCEALRAMLRFARQHGRADLHGPAARTLDLLRRRFIDPEHGGWFMRVEPDGTVPDTAKGNAWKVDYHVVGACLEGIQGWGPEGSPAAA